MNNILLGGCPRCGSQQCIAGSCQREAIANTRLGPPAVKPRMRFDFDRWMELLAHSVKLRGISWKELSEATGVSESTLSRIKCGRQPDAASLAV